MRESETIIEAELRAAVTEGARRYFAARRARIGPFARRAFGLRGAFRLHRAALGWDLARAPANLALAPANVAARLASFGLRALGMRRAADWLGRRRLLLDTDVAEAARRLVIADLLELPTEDDPHDALAEAILADPEVRVFLAGALPALDEAGRRRRVAGALSEYGGARTATAEIATALATLGAGAAAFQALTPGPFSLGPALAAGYAQSAAIAAFPLGATAGGLWYGLFPASASPALVMSATSAVMAAGALGAAFAGVVADPVQTALGLHQRRLRRLIDALERQFVEGEGAGLAVREHYVARLLDLADTVLAASRAFRG